MADAKDIPDLSKLAIKDPVQPAKEEVCVNPRITEIYTKIKNADAIEQIGKYFKVVPTLAKLPKLGKQSEWFGTLNLNRNMEACDGENFIIDVQPDFRFPVAYIIYHCVHSIERLEMREEPTLSLFTYIAYELVMFSTSLLAQDIAVRRPRSLWANAYQNDHERAQYFANLLNMNVTLETAQLIEHLMAAHDANKPALEFIPSFAGGKFVHDYGRLLPPQIFMAMHNLLSEVRVNQPINEIIRQLHDILIITVNNRPYRVTHFIGGLYQVGANLHQHDNWIYDLINTIFNPAVGRAHIQRPVLAQIKVTPQEIEDTSPNMYDLMLMYNQDDIGRIEASMTRISAYMDGNAQIQHIRLGDAIIRGGGITVLSHSVESMTMPTWHFLDRPTVVQALTTRITEDTNNAFNTLTNYMAGDQAFTGALPSMHETDPPLDPNFYQIGNKAYDKTKPPIVVKRWTPTRDLNPSAFLFQPYERNANRGALTISLGIKICSEELDACIVPMPNNMDSLYENNSCYQVGSMPIRMIKPIIPQTDPNAAVRFIRRHRRTDEINGFAIRDGGQNIVPEFANQNVRPNMEGYEGLVLEQNHNDNQRAFTYAAWRDGDGHNVPERSRYLWSSYRYVTSANTRARGVNFYFSFRPLYGTCVPLIRINDPARLLPHV